MLPANQEFRTDQLAIRVDLPLVKRHQLLCADGVAQFYFKPVTLQQRRLYRRVEESKGILASGFSLIHRNIRLLHELLDRQFPADEQKRPHAGSDPMLKLFLSEGPGERMQNLFSDALNLSGGLHRV